MKRYRIRAGSPLDIILIIASVIIASILGNLIHSAVERIAADTPQPIVEAAEPQIEVIEEEPTPQYLYAELYMRDTGVSSAKTYMCYSKITNTKSKQYRMIHESGEITIDERGYLRNEDGFYGVALGSYFGPVGCRYAFTLDTGIVLHVVKVEEKADEDTIDGYSHKIDGSVIEFVVDTSAEYMQENVWGNGLIFSGNFNNNPEFKGSIVKIERVVDAI